ncbi:hypothetical protein AVEN_216386-1 [Araneus ventricosus]|uniref:HTH CENPB-type domain-containing protein n=1 Tax=Araneus ventricosus TaxID=182803 RepID=A0A4Y2SRQ4_ARAVE|nr:hypothetical protein AVEN_216386-1 [Araneus ventricosus]
MENFSASHGWVEKFKNRHSLATRILSGEIASVNEGTAEQWEGNLASLVNGYEPKNICNCDETGLFYKLMPDKTLTFKREPCHGGKKVKVKNENLITTQLREIEDIATEINGGEEDKEEDNDDEEDAAKVPPTHTVALEALETLRDYFQFNSGSEGTFSRLDELEKNLFENSRKQSSIVNYFVKV